MSTRIRVPIQVLPHGRDLGLPRYATAGSSGVDLCAAVVDAMILAPGGRTLVPTGVAVALPAGFEFQVRPRSGLAYRHGITVLNTPGTVDADYRGEIKVVLANLGAESFRIERGLRIAQMVLARVEVIEWDMVEKLDGTDRGEGGFGHTGA